MWKIAFFVLSIGILTVVTLDMPKAQDDASAISKKPSTAEKAAKDLSVAKGKIEQALCKAAATKELNLSQEAKDVITKEIINREIYKGVPPPKISISDSESNELIGGIATKVKGDEVTAGVAVSIIEEEKMEEVIAELPHQILVTAKMAGIEVKGEAEELLRYDLLRQTKFNAKSGLPIQEIRTRNEEYLKAIYASMPSEVLDKKTYKQVRSLIFQRLIKLTISSNPSGANVEIAGIPIGRTTIEEKPFESGKEYSFLFRLSGYKTSVRKYFVTLYPPKQEFTEILFEEKKDDQT